MADQTGIDGLIQFVLEQHVTQHGTEPTPRTEGNQEVESKDKSWDRMTRYGDDVPHAFIQWKGTDVCMDFYCSCGGYGHIDGMFVYYIKCADCGQVYASPAYMSNFVPLLEGEEPDHEPFVAYDDSDEWGSKCLPTTK